MEFGAQQHGCEHYRRGCNVVAPCCGEVFGCRHCHNDAKNSLEVHLRDRHEIPRHEIKKSSEDSQNCGWTHWVDPPVNGIFQEYIAYLHNKIFDLERELEEPSLSDSMQTISIANDDVVFCDNLRCPCPHHKAGGARGPPPVEGPVPVPARPPPALPQPQPQRQPPYGCNNYYNDYGSQGSSSYM